VEKAERDLILRQGIVLPETPRDRRERAGLEEDLRSIPLRGKPLPLRLRNFIPRADAYLAASQGPHRYMLRLREIEERTAAHEAELGEAWRSLSKAHEHEASSFSDAWRAAAASWPFDEVNELIERHNRWYPVEARLPMDPRTGDYALVNGRVYRLEALDATWVLGRFPPILERAVALT
jgi:hypothetical protein